MAFTGVIDDVTVDAEDIAADAVELSEAFAGPGGSVDESSTAPMLTMISNKRRMTETMSQTRRIDSFVDTDTSSRRLASNPRESRSTITQFGRFVEFASIQTIGKGWRGVSNIVDANFISHIRDEVPVWRSTRHKGEDVDKGYDKD